MRSARLRLGRASVMVLLGIASGLTSFGAARAHSPEPPGRPAAVVQHARTTRTLPKPGRPEPLLVGWHDELNTVDQWSPLPPPHNAAIAAPTPGLTELSMGPTPAGYPYPFQWGGVHRVASVDLDRYPVMAVQALVVGPHTYWDFSAQPLKPGGVVATETKSTSTTRPGVQFVDLGAAGLKGQQSLEIRLHVGGSPKGYEVADYGWVRFIRRQDEARLQKNPELSDVKLVISAAPGVPSPGAPSPGAPSPGMPSRGAPSPGFGTAPAAPRAGLVGGVTLDRLSTLEGHTGPVGGGIQFSPDGTMLASSAEDGVVIVWKIPSGTVVKSLPGHLRAGITAACFSPDGRLLAAPGADGNVELWLTSDWSLWKELPGGASPLAFSPVGEKLAACLPTDRSVRIWDLKTSVVERVIPMRSSLPPSSALPASPLIEALCYSPDGSMLATASDDGAVRIWAPQTGALLRTLRGHVGVVRCLRFSGDGRWLASAGEDQVVRLWPVDGGTPKVLGYAPQLIGSVAFSRDGSVVAAGTEGQLLLWRSDDGEPLGLVNATRDWINALAFSPDGHLLAVGSRDHSVTLWQFSELHG